MPKVPVDYSKTCIYKLVHFDDINDENMLKITILSVKWICDIRGYIDRGNLSSI